ncbi:Abi-alpha family protein [Methylobacterium sp. Leaf361]|uniref:Abi-alpha family protein n=1 Tax=Methylobacterium sp. Leaf361 TaxID=1736352 RepID=UPI000A4C4C92|nr:Abi-alpha family protein [Methylobacterium sp. Leaf361]
MADKDPMTAAAEAAAREVVKVAYGDLLQPAARIVGNELGEFVSAIVVAGRGFGYLIREKYEPFILKALNNVPIEERIVPKPEVVGNILEGVTYEEEGSDIYVMFEELLSKAMHKEFRDTVHPAFSGILKRMSSIEASLIKDISAGQFFVTASGRNGVYFNIQFPLKVEDRKIFARGADVHFDNLRGMGLIQFISFSARPQIRHIEDMADAIQKLASGRSSTGSYNVRLTPLGEAFTQACIRKS